MMPTDHRIIGQRIINQRTTCHRTRRRTICAFTLVELMVVVVIIAVMATVVTISVTDYLVKGKRSAAKSEITSISNALQLYYTEYDHYPSNDEGLAALTKTRDDHPGGILKGDLLDPWGHAYVYTYPGLRDVFDVCSYGANGIEGGTGADADLCSYDLGEKP